MRIKQATVYSTCLLLSVLSAAAHHGTSTYDMTTEVSLTGTIKQWTFGNPHTWLWLDVSISQKQTAEWSIESAPPNYLTGQGWSASTLKAGERVSVLISPLKTEPKRGILLEVKRASGETLIVRPRGSFGRPAAVR